MKQFYYTSCLKETSVNGNAGFQIRAVTDTSDISLVEKILKYSGYQIPTDIPIDLSSGTKPPIKMTYLKLDSGDYCLIHTCYVGKTPEIYISGIGRWGNYFTHGILQLDQSISAKNAIASWGSPFWKTKDPDPLNPLILQEILDIPQNDFLNYSLFELDEENEYKEKLLDSIEFIVNAYLSLKDDQKIFVAADSDVFAHLFHALCGCLPEKMLKDLTFSTYEYSPQSSSAKIICTFMLSDKSFDPISFSYENERYIGINLFNNKKSKIKKHYEYASFVRDILSMGAMQNLEPFCKLCNQYNIDNGEEVELLFQFYKSGDKIDFGVKTAEALSNKNATLMYVISQHAGIEWILNLALSSDSFINNTFFDIIKQIKQETQRDFFRDAIYKKAIEAIENNRLIELKRLIDKIYIRFPKKADNDILQRLILLTDSLPINQIQSISWDIKSYLFKKWSDSQNVEDTKDQLKNWLSTISPEEFPSLFSLQLDTDFLVIAVVVHIDNKNLELIPYKYVIMHELVESIIDYYYNNESIEKALYFYKYCHKKCFSFNNFFPHKILINITNSIKTFQSINNNKSNNYHKRILLIKKLSASMDNLSAEDIYYLFSTYIFNNSVSMIDFLLEHLRQEKILITWVSTFLTSPNTNWLKYDFPILLDQIESNFNLSETAKKFIRQWRILHKMLSKLIKVKEEDISEVSELIVYLSTMRRVNKLEELKNVITRQLASKLIEQSCSSLSLLGLLIDNLGKPLSGTIKQFCFDLTEALGRDRNLYHIDNVHLIDNIIRKLSYLAKEDDVAERYIEKIFEAVIKRKDSNFFSILDKQFGQSESKDLWKKLKKSKKSYYF